MSQAYRGRTRFLRAVLIVVGANYLAQIPYYLHLYYFPHGALPSLATSALLGLTLAWFLAGYVSLAQGNGKGYWLLLSFLATEVFFYAYNIVNQVRHGFPPFMHLQSRDPILLVVFSIGYVNLLAGCYFLSYLARHHRDLRADYSRLARAG